MKVRKRKRKKYEPLYPGMKPPWKPGQSGNPKGRPVGSGSFKTLIRHLLAVQVPPRKGSKEFRTIKDQLAEIAIKRAKRGDFAFWQKVVDLHELRQVNEEELNEFLDIVFTVVKKHVAKLEGGREALEVIARDLNRKDGN